MSSNATTSKSIINISASLFFALLLWFACNQAKDEHESEITKVAVTNSDSLPIVAYLTLSGGAGYVSDVKGVFGIVTTGLQGCFTIQPNDTIFYTTPYKKALSGNLTFGTPPLNCATEQFPNGINLFEITLNNGHTVPKAQETIDISCVAGVNAIAELSMKGGGNWVATTGIDSVTSIYNDTLYGNYELIGVFPYGCDNCTSSSNPPDCPDHKPYAKAQPSPTCNISRNAKEDSGGLVLIEFIRYPK
jgi:hypothetical protein